MTIHLAGLHIQLLLRAIIWPGAFAAVSAVQHCAGGYAQFETATYNHLPAAAAHAQGSGDRLAMHMQGLVWS